MNNKVKVIKAIKGLEVGDILYLDVDNSQYTNLKTYEDISDNKTITKTSQTTIDRWAVEQSPEYFVYLDENDNDIQMNTVRYEDLHPSEFQIKVDSNKPISTTSTVFYRFRSPIERYLVWL